MAKAAIIGSGNIGTDLMIKIMRQGRGIEMGVMVGIDASSEGLARARRMGVATTDRGVEGLIGMDEFGSVDIVFDATSAKAHRHNAAALEPYGKTMMDLTPAAIGPLVVPTVNLEQHVRATNVNMVTCGGQATVPIVAAISRVANVYYAEIIASIASKSAGPGTRANIDEFTETTAHAIETVGGAAKGKAIIVLNPAEPPLLMRDTVITLSEQVDHDLVRNSIMEAVARVQSYVPGYRLKQDIQFDLIGDNSAPKIPGMGRRSGLKTTVFLEVEGAAHYLPKYAGNLDIMTAAALATAESIVERR